MVSQEEQNIKMRAHTDLFTLESTRTPKTHDLISIVDLYKMKKAMHA